VGERLFCEISASRNLGCDEWFKPFDSPSLTFPCQERLRNGEQSNVLPLDNPNREDV